MNEARRVALNVLQIYRGGKERKTQRKKERERDIYLMKIGASKSRANSSLAQKEKRGETGKVERKLIRDRETFATPDIRLIFRRVLVS